MSASRSQSPEHSASGFYSHLRSARLHSHQGAPAHGSQDVHRRLQMILANSTAQRSGGGSGPTSTGHHTPTSSAHPATLHHHPPAVVLHQQQPAANYAHAQPTVVGLEPRRNGSPTQASYSAVQPTYAGGPSSSSSPPGRGNSQRPQQQQEEGSLSAAEVSALRMVEIDPKFSVEAEVQNAGSSSGSTDGPQLLCEDASVKVFNKHIIFSRPDGTPVAELVILELFELEEHEDSNMLSFHLQRPTGTATIYATTTSPAARTALYKLVCAKRNMLEAQRTGSGLQAPQPGAPVVTHHNAAAALRQ